MIKRIGGNQRDKPRQPNDLYPTPEIATLVLLKHYTPTQYIWEPACGNMDISNVLMKHGHDVKSTDISSGWNLFDCNEFFNGDIITNPPYSVALQFVEKCLLLTNDSVCMLLPIGFLTSAKRRSLLQSGKLKKVIILTNRLKIIVGDEVISSQFNHTWCIFKNDGAVDKPMLIFE